MDALAAQIQNKLCGTASPQVIMGLQVDGRLIPSPTPPAIDIYPGDPFQEPFGFGPGNHRYWFTVRARVSMADNEGGQDLLLSMMDPQAATSVEQAILSDATLGGVAQLKEVDGPTAFGIFDDPGPQPERLLGCVWRVGVVLPCESCG